MTEFIDSASSSNTTPNKFGKKLQDALCINEKLKNIIFNEKTKIPYKLSEYTQDHDRVQIYVHISPTGEMTPYNAFNPTEEPASMNLETRSYSVYRKRRSKLRRSKETDAIAFEGKTPEISTPIPQPPEEQPLLSDDQLTHERLIAQVEEYKQANLMYKHSLEAQVFRTLTAENNLRAALASPASIDQQRFSLKNLFANEIKTSTHQLDEMNKLSSLNNGLTMQVQNLNIELIQRQLYYDVIMRDNIALRQHITSPCSKLLESEKPSEGDQKEADNSQYPASSSSESNQERYTPGFFIHNQVIDQSNRKRKENNYSDSPQIDNLNDTEAQPPFKIGKFK